MEELIGKKIQNYKIVSILGKGGMGIVYKAYDNNLDRNVAIKILNPQVLDKSILIERFKREAKNQAKLSHPNVVTVYGFLEYENLLGIAMEFVDGESIEKIVFRQKGLNLFDAVYIMKNALAGIGYAHAKGFIHRDIKPSNILLSKEGDVKIMDFGISKSLFDKGLTKTGAKLGTVYYMSPEQIRGEKITTQTDLYSVGCSFYEMITGQPPFDLETEYEVMDSHLKSEAPKISALIPGTPPLIDKIITKSMQKDPANRYKTANEFLADIESLEKYLSSMDAKSEIPRRESTKKQKVFSIISFAGFILIFIALAYFAFIKVDELLKSDHLEQFEKFNIQTLFKDNDEAAYSELKLVELPNKESLNSVKFLSTGFGCAVGENGTISTSNNSGETWQLVDLNNSADLYDEYIFENGKSFVIGDSSSIFYSDYFFKDLKRIFLPGNYTLFKIDFIDEMTGFIAGSQGLILKTIDGGKSWKQKATGTKNQIYDFIFISGELGFAVGWDGMILSTDNGGESWRTIKFITQKYLKAIDFIDDENGMIAGGGGELYKTNDGGENWNLVPVPSRISGLQDVQYVTEETVFVVGNKGLILVSKDGGGSWYEIETKLFINLNKISKLDNRNVFVSGNNGSIIKIF